MRERLRPSRIHLTTGQTLVKRNRWRRRSFFVVRSGALSPRRPTLGKLHCEAQSRTMLLRSVSAMPQQAVRTARIEARIAPDTLRVVRRAAELQGRSISDFVVAAAQEVAHRTIDAAQVIRLSVEDQQRFVELLLSPPALAPALKRAKKAHSRLIASSR